MANKAREDAKRRRVPDGIPGEAKARRAGPPAEADAEDPRDAKGAFEGGGVAALFDGDHGLPRHADLFGQGRLAHPVMGLSQGLHTVQDRGAFGHAYTPRR